MKLNYHFHFGYIGIIALYLMAKFVLRDEATAMVILAVAMVPLILDKK